MSFSVYVCFSGNCREAVTFYAGVFGKDVPSFLTYGDVPESPDSNFSISEGMKDKIMHCELEIGGVEVMFCDMPDEFDLIKGNNISLFFGTRDQKEIETVFSRLKEGGTVASELQETFYATLYGMIVDKFGMTWQLTYADPSKCGSSLHDA
ncbi:hypothetical protein MmiHf6_11050 [Methanimicrococcus hongohii]|uniref:PhnB-like domain-containing protein n=1 Tax=Methanimicrococcus hongohii TaxID=3028295 RepID=A0AA96V1T7_9EURY|nr:VOC family protein [Methanimicrococcus sp. Hf6]WNY23790.1 hypothetical protein MmiHf6_11050 [Methanimicrococcus sp. Hf6]